MPVSTWECAECVGSAFSIYCPNKSQWRETGGMDRAGKRRRKRNACMAPWFMWRWKREREEERVRKEWRHNPTEQQASSHLLVSAVTQRAQTFFQLLVAQFQNEKYAYNYIFKQQKYVAEKPICWIYFKHYILLGFRQLESLKMAYQCDITHMENKWESRRTNGLKITFKPESLTSSASFYLIEWRISPKLDSLAGLKSSVKMWPSSMLHTNIKHVLSM